MLDAHVAAAAEEVDAEDGAEESLSLWPAVAHLDADTGSKRPGFFEFDRLGFSRFVRSAIGVDQAGGGGRALRGQALILAVALPQGDQAGEDGRVLFELDAQRAGGDGDPGARFGNFERIVDWRGHGVTAVLDAQFLLAVAGEIEQGPAHGAIGPARQGAGL